MKIWGRCGDCDRWFYCPTGRGEATDWLCPGCGHEPIAIENRQQPCAAAGVRVVVTLPVVAAAEVGR